MNSFEQVARMRYNGCQFTGGSGAWASISLCGVAPRVYFCEDAEQARGYALGPCGANDCMGRHRFEEMRIVPVPNIEDDYEDRVYERRQRRA
jgi:hypothetical protein